MIQFSLLMGSMVLHLCRDMLKVVNSKFYDNIFSVFEPSDLGRKSDDGFLEHVVEVSGDEPSPRKRFTHFTEVFSVGIKFFGTAGDIPALTSLSVGVLRTTLEERGVGLCEFPKNEEHGLLRVAVGVGFAEQNEPAAT
jgi:hypothetical protein